MFIMFKKCLRTKTIIEESVVEVNPTFVEESKNVKTWEFLTELESYSVLDFAKRHFLLNATTSHLIRRNWQEVNERLRKIARQKFFAHYL